MLKHRGVKHCVLVELHVCENTQVVCQNSRWVHTNFIKKYISFYLLFGDNFDLNQCSPCSNVNKALDLKSLVTAKKVIQLRKIQSYNLANFSEEVYYDLV